MDIWHWNDVDVMAKQKLTATADRRRNYLSAWHLDTNRFGSKAFLYRAGGPDDPAKRRVRRGVGHLRDGSIDWPWRRPLRHRSDDGRADEDQGSRRRSCAQVSPTGRCVLFLEDDHYWTIDLSSRTVRNLTKSVATAFIDRESDATIKQSRHSASPAGRKTMRPWCCMTSSTSGRWRRTGRARRV